LRLSRSYTERANSAVSTKLSSTFSQLMWSNQHSFRFPSWRH
jgi:hypothetical protein